MGRVLQFDQAVYAGLVQDPAATAQASWAVGIAAAAAAIGTALMGGWQAGAILGAAIAAIVHWLLWTGLIYLIAATLFHSTTSLRRLLTAMGYAQAPQVIAILGFIPVVGPWVVLLSRLLTVVSTFQAMGSTIALDRRRQIATNVLAFAASFVVTTLLKARLGDIGPWQALGRP
jgi:hypothetical protein